MVRAGRAIVQYAYTSTTTRQTYASILLGLENASGKYALPGGQFDQRQDRDTLDTAIRELEEELGLHSSRSTAKKIGTYHGRSVEQDLYLLQATGSVLVNPREIQEIGFYNAGRHNQIPAGLSESHLEALKTMYFGSPNYSRNTSPIRISGHYINEWHRRASRF